MYLIGVLSGLLPNLDKIILFCQIFWQAKNYTFILKTSVRYFYMLYSIMLSQKTRWVAPLMTDSPPTSSTTLSNLFLRMIFFIYIKKFLKKFDMWQVTRNTWHVTGDRWHVTRDMWHMTHDTFSGINILSKYQLPSSSGLGWRVFRRYFN